MSMISSDQLTMIATILVPMLGAFWAILHKMDQKFDKVDQKFEKMDHELQDIKTRLTVLETVMGLISGGLKIQHQPKERTDP